ncbi:hypothetical protein L3Q67_24745 [Saccharothrix sp. AJ9571]|nr:hypothetical protein L3Q67_24745 [Saccharothrix sp. AJ9571]
MPHPLPVRWQLDLLAYDESAPYPVLSLQPSTPRGYRRLSGLLARTGMAHCLPWEWERGLWPLTVDCVVEFHDDPLTATVHAAGCAISMDTRIPAPLAHWSTIARSRGNVLFMLVPPDAAQSNLSVVFDDIARSGKSVRARELLVGLTAVRTDTG